MTRDKQIALYLAMGFDLLPLRGGKAEDASTRPGGKQNMNKDEQPTFFTVSIKSRKDDAGKERDAVEFEQDGVIKKRGRIDEALEAVFSEWDIDGVFDASAPEGKKGVLLFNKAGEVDGTIITIGRDNQGAKESRKFLLLNLLTDWPDPIKRKKIIKYLQSQGAVEQEITGKIEQEMREREISQYQRLLPLTVILPDTTYRAERNLLTFPIAVLGKPKPGQTYVSYTNKKTGVTTEAGSMYGVLTEFDFRVFHAIQALTQRITLKNGLVLSGAKFSQWGMAKYLNLQPSGWNWKRISQALKKIADLRITHSSFKTRDKTLEWKNQGVFFHPIIKQEGDQAVENTFIWDPVIGANLGNWYEFIDGKVLGALGATAGRLYCYVKTRMGEKGTHKEAWESIADHLPLTVKHKPRKKEIFKEACRKLNVFTGIFYKEDERGIITFRDPPKKTKEDHQIEARAEVDGRVKKIEQAREMNEKQTRICVRLIRLGVDDPGYVKQLLMSTISLEYILEEVEKLERKKEAGKLKNPTGYLKKVFTLTGPQPDYDENEDYPDEIVTPTKPSPGGLCFDTKRLITEGKNRRELTREQVCQEYQKVLDVLVGLSVISKDLPMGDPYDSPYGLKRLNPWEVKNLMVERGVSEKVAFQVKNKLDELKQYHLGEEKVWTL